VGPIGAKADILHHEGSGGVVGGRSLSGRVELHGGGHSTPLTLFGDGLVLSAESDEGGMTVVGGGACDTHGDRKQFYFPLIVFYFAARNNIVSAQQILHSYMIRKSLFLST
jgi:hypothetical protein